MESQSSSNSIQRCPTVGVFDSGVGGLTVARVLLRRLPGIRLLYFGDTAHVPYGPRPIEQIRDFALQIMEFLINQGADAVVMGCNMSSAAGAREAAVARFSQPIFEVIRPGSRAAVAASATGNIGVIATQGTVQSGAYLRALQAAGIEKVLQQACPKFVPLVERGRDDGPEVDAAVAEYLRPLRDGGIDTLVFGCTHYPILRTPIARFLGDGVTLIDPAEPTTDDVQALFGPLPAVCTTEPQRHRFFCSGDPDSLRQVGERLLGFPPGQIEQVNVPVE